MIRFLIKSVFFLTLLLVAISFFGPTSKKGSLDAQTGETGTFDALIALKDTVSDLGGFCTRNSETCETGKSFLGSLGERARDGAKITYEYLDEKFGGNTQKAESETLPKSTNADAPSSPYRNNDTNEENPPLETKAPLAKQLPANKSNTKHKNDDLQ